MLVGDGQLAMCARRRRSLLRQLAPTIAILSGPMSAEDRAYLRETAHETSSTHDLQRSLIRLGAHQVDVIDVTEDPRWPDRCTGYDLVVINLHGVPGEDGTVQQLLRDRGVPFVGSDVEASVVGISKNLTKRVAEQLGVKTPRYSVLDGAVSREVEALSGATLDGERICKPLRGGSSLGIVRLSAGEPEPAEGDWLVEEFLPGNDVTVTVVEADGKPVALPGVVLSHGGEYYDAIAKLSSEESHHAVASRPAELAQCVSQCEAMAVAIHVGIVARHVSRSDFVVSGGVSYFLEINTLPGLSEISNAAECAGAGGLTYDEFVALLAGAALE